MEQTAVEYLYKIIHARIHIDKDLSEYLEQAKEIEKKQIERAFMFGQYAISIEDGEQYYNETFKNKNNED